MNFNRDKTQWLNWMNQYELNRFCAWLVKAKLKAKDLDRLREIVDQKQKEAEE